MWEMSNLSLLDDTTRNQIRTLIISGKNIKQIQEEMGISPGTWDTYYWRDDKGFRSFVLDCHDERLRIIARQNIDDIVNMPIGDDSDPRYLKIKADMTTFVAERVDKERFGKTTEDNGDKAPINIAINNYKRIQTLKKQLPPPEKP